MRGRISRGPRPERSTPRRPAALILALLTLSACGPDLSLLAGRLVAGYEEILAEGAIHVAPGGSDTDPGSRSYPKATPAAAATLAARLIERGDAAALEVRLAAGTYPLAETLVIPGGVDLLGGYDAEGWDRTAGEDATVLELAPGGTVLEVAGPGPQRVDGLVLRSGAAPGAVGVSCTDANAEITRCTINVAAGRSESVGILVEGGSAVIDANTVVFGGADDYAAGIAVVDATARLSNNVVAGAAGAGPLVCIQLSGSDVRLLNNTLHGGFRASDMLILLSGSGAEVINTVLLGSQPCCAIRLADAGAVIDGLWNNDFLTCTAPILRDAVGGEYASVGEVETYLGASAGDNVAEIDPVFADLPGGDYHITVNPMAGIDLSAEFTTDRDGVSRTPAWSVGAYELD